MVIAFTMFFMHPVSLGISLGSALAYAVYLRGRKAIRFSLVFMLPMMAMAALINPASTMRGRPCLHTCLREIRSHWRVSCMD